MVEIVEVQAQNTGPTLEEEAAAQEAAAKAAKDGEPKLSGEGETEERPEWLPVKFRTPEDMAKAYAELEKKNSTGEATPEETQEAAEKAVESAGLDMDALSKEYAENGELSKDSKEALAKVGITDAMVQAYTAGLEAQAEAATAELLAPLGGSEEAYGEMIEWAADNLSDAEIDAFNTVIEGSDGAAMKMAVENLHTKYTAANGTEPQRQVSGRPGNGSMSVYESTADLMKDMQNPEYAQNPAFRAKVAAKLERSNIM